MLLEPRLLDLLCCPDKHCRGDLVATQAKNKEEILSCVCCGRCYRVIDGIPVLFPVNKHEYSVKEQKNYHKAMGTDDTLALVSGIDLGNKTILDCNVEENFLVKYPNAKLRIYVSGSLSLLRKNKINAPGYFFICAQDDYIPLKDATADVAVHTGIIEEGTFSEIVRVTHPGGSVVLSTLSTPKKITKWCRRNFIKPISWNGKSPRFSPAVSVTLPTMITMVGSVQARVMPPMIHERLLRRTVLQFAKQKTATFIRRFENRNKKFIAADHIHLERTLGWLKRAQDATPDGGVSRGNSLIPFGKGNEEGWQPSYPETTGYIIPTMIAAARRLHDKTLFHRAELMGRWELGIQREDGSVHGGNIAETPAPAVFDTGQVMRGYYALFVVTRDERYRIAAERAGNWIIAQEHNNEGRWITSNALSVDQTTTTYIVYALSPLAEWGKLLGKQEWIEAARRSAQSTLAAQEKTGWFAHCDFHDSEQPLLHTIGYTIDGLWDIGVVLGEKKFTEGARRALDGVLSVMEENGRLPGRLNRNWGTDTDWACLTGIAQIGVTAMKVYRATGDISYKEKAERAKEYLKTVQNNYDNEHGGGIGAVWGSWPISGEYSSYQSLNWAAKYFADLLLMLTSAEGDMTDAEVIKTPHY